MKIAIIGAGSFGTALGANLSSKGLSIALWSRQPELVKEINRRHANSRYLGDLTLPSSLQADTDQERILAGAGIIILAIPAQQIAPYIGKYGRLLPVGTPIVSVAKGIEEGSLRLVSEILEEELPESYHSSFCYLSGPSFAREIMLRTPTAVCIASKNENTARFVQETFYNSCLRTYRTVDVIGVEISGAMKNVIAIAAGVVDGLALGHNARAALITRGLAEITRLGLAKGADISTFLGLAGVGDLILTCTGDLSRNRQVGLMLGQGKKFKQILAEKEQLAEGVYTCRSAYQLSQKMGVEMFITEQVYRVIYEGKAPRASLHEIMERELKREGF